MRTYRTGQDHMAAWGGGSNSLEFGAFERPLDAPAPMKILAVLALSFVVAACAPSAPSGAVSSGATAEATLVGSVTYRPRIALPPEAVVEVQLQDVSRADAPATVLARQSIPTEGRQVPIPFALTYAPDEIQSGRRYVVRAQIRDAAGALLWTTDTARPVLADGPEAESVDLVLVAASGDGGEAAGAVPLGIRYRLIEFVRDGEGVVLPPGEELTVQFDEDGRYGGRAGCNSYGGPYAEDDGVVLEPAAATLMMCLGPSASTAFLRALDGARVEAVRPHTLTLVSPDGDRLTFEDGLDAWGEARAAGASLRAVGQEPGWTLTITPDARIEFVTDYGERRVVVPDPGAQRDDGATVYRATTEAADLRVVVTSAPCEDAMSGAPYPLTVEVTLDGETVRGCGRGL